MEWFLDIFERPKMILIIITAASTRPKRTIFLVIEKVGCPTPLNEIVGSSGGES
jgi:hypothetical protein